MTKTSPFLNRHEFQAHCKNDHFMSLPPKFIHLDTVAKMSKKCPICQVAMRSGKRFIVHANAEHYDLISRQFWKKCQRCDNFFPKKICSEKTSANSVPF